MAIGQPHKIVEDTPSEMVRVSRKELNKLIDIVDALVTGLETAAAIGDVNTLATGLDTTSLRKVLAIHERPDAHAVPTT